MVEYDLPKVGAEGSIPFSRSSVWVHLVLCGRVMPALNCQLGVLLSWNDGDHKP